MESAHHFSSRPDCNNSPHVPSLILRTDLPAITFVSDLCVVSTYNDSRKDLHRLCQIPKNCRCKRLLVSSSAPRTFVGSFAIPAKFLFCTGKNWFHCAYRWLFRDSHRSLRTFVIRCDQVTKMFRSGHDCTNTSSARRPCYLRLQANITIWVLRKVRVYTVLTEPSSTFARDSIGSSWDDLEVSWLPCSEFP